MKQNYFISIFLLITISLAACSGIIQDDTVIVYQESEENFMTEVTYPKETNAVEFDMNMAYIGVGNCVHILQFANPKHYDVTGIHCGLNGVVQSLVLNDEILFVGAGDTVYALDINNPGMITQKGIFETRGEVYKMLFSNDFLYVAEGEMGVEKLDVANPGEM